MVLEFLMFLKMETVLSFPIFIHVYPFQSDVSGEVIKIFRRDGGK